MNQKASLHRIRPSILERLQETRQKRVRAVRQQLRQQVKRRDPLRPREQVVTEENRDGRR